MLRGPVPLEISRGLIIVWVLPAIAMLLTLLVLRNARPHTQHNVVRTVRIMLLVYLVGAFILTHWPLDFAFDPDRLDDGNWRPLGGSLGFLISDNTLQNELGGRDVLANVVLFIPFGLLLLYSFRRWRSVALAAAIVVGLAFGLEISQGFFVAERTIDIDDAISGLAGGIVALALASLFRPVASRD